VGVFARIGKFERDIKIVPLPEECPQPGVRPRTGSAANGLTT